MKKTVSLAIVFLVGLCIGKFWQGSPADAEAAAPATPVAAENGDTNGDGERDLSDAVYLLQWLFTGGPEPAPVSRDCPPRFVDNGDGTVTDTQTGFLWLKRPVDANGDGSITFDDCVSPDRARELAAALRVGGYDDWDVPLTSELVSLVQYPGRGYGTSVLDPVFEVDQGNYWIASTNGGDPCHGASFSMSVGGFVELNQWFAYLLAVRTPPEGLAR